MRLPLSLAAVTASLLVLVCGCADGAGPGPQTTSTSAAASAGTAAAAGPHDAHDAHTELPAPPPAPATGAESDAAALAAAEQVMAAFVHPELDAEAWFRGLAPLLTPAAQQDYLGTDPVQIPARAVTGAPRLGDSPSAYLAYASVPTDAGDYRVLLVREGAGLPWLAETITPPAGVR